MRFSLFTVVDHYEDGSRSLATRYEQLLDQIVEADRLGFDAFWIGEHHGYLTPKLALACSNPAIVLSAAAQRTQRIGLNTAVANLSLRLLAEEVIPRFRESFPDFQQMMAEESTHESIAK